MDTDGWYIVQAIVPAGETDAGQECWAIMLNGEWQQGFPLTIKGTEEAFTWGPENGKGVLEWRR